MPVYEYACKACDHEFEEWQKMSDPPVKKCPKCGKAKVEKLISRTSFQLKGGGWYSDLYASAKANDKAGDKASDSGGDKADKSEKSDVKAEAKVEKADKSESKAQSKSEKKAGDTGKKTEGKAKPAAAK